MTKLENRIECLSWFAWLRDSPYSFMQLKSSWFVNEVKSVCYIALMALFLLVARDMIMATVVILICITAQMG